MKFYNIFFLLSAFAFGGAFVYTTLNYTPQLISMVLIGLASIGVGFFFKKYSK